MILEDGQGYDITMVLQFPTSSNQGGCVKNFDNIEDAKKYTVEMFNDFKKLINK
jgi:hypothetical protein